MDVICKPIKKSKDPLIKTRNKVRNKLPHETCKYMNAKINCAALSRCCSCCKNLQCTSQPCSLLNESAEIKSLDSEKYSFSGETEFCKKTNSFEKLCVKTPSWEPCLGTVEKRLGYSESEISYFIKVIEQKLRDSLDRGCELLVCGNSTASGEIPGARICRGTSLGNNVQRASFTDDVSAGSLTCDSPDGEEDKEELSKDPGQGPVQDICGSYKPIILCLEKKHEEYSCETKSEENSEAESTRLDFKVGDLGRSEEVGKWGELNIADRLLANYKQTNSLKLPGPDTDDVFCEPMDKLDQQNKFFCSNKKGLATICRHLFRWSNRLSKKWRSIISQPHVVIHLPSIAYPFEIRRRAPRIFDFLQNRQVSRLGWLGNENAQVLYVFPSNQSLEMITLFRDLIKNVRPDVNENRLWIIQPDSLKTRCLNGSRALFQSSKAYRRVKMLTAGRQAFVLPGVIEEIDVFIASELRVPIIGPPLEFQNHFLNKSNVANFLRDIKVEQPPFVTNVHNFPELCGGLAHLMIEFPNYVTWLIKINYGINGLQTALINFEKSSWRKIIAAKRKKCPCNTSEKKLALFLMEILPGEMILNEKAYKSYKEFFCDLEKYGGLVQGCPYVGYRVLSLGVFVEHDTATPEVCASADVFHDPQDLTTDLCYGIPQATAARSPLENLVVNVGIALRDWQYIGYFGMDVVALTDEDSMDKFLVVDIDPHYTDVISFTDWVRFCLGVRSPCQCCQSKVSSHQKNTDRSQTTVKKAKIHSSKITKAEDTMERYAMCSSRLYSNGLAKYCGSTLVSLCKERNVGYNFEIKQGSMICPIDSDRRALGLVSLYPKRSQAIDEFAKGLRVLHELSLEKHNGKIKTNMLVSYRGLFSCPKLARALERRDLEKTANGKKDKSSE